MPNVVLSEDTQIDLNGVNLKWNISGLATIREITLIYYVNDTDSRIMSNTIDPSLSKFNLSLDPNTEYCLQLQVVDNAGVICYSNVITITSDASLSEPYIASIAGGDAYLDVELQPDSNGLTAADQVEFVVKREDGQLFWISKPYSVDGIYRLSPSDNALIINSKTYRVACMFQPAANNAIYHAPSPISNTEYGMPTNLPDEPRSIALLDMLTGHTLRLKATWQAPADFDEWSNNFFIRYGLCKNAGSPNAEWQMTECPRNQEVNEQIFDNLERDTFYQFQVAYVNRFGSSRTIYSQLMKPSCLPDAPSIISVSNADTSAAVIVSLPAFDGQKPLGTLLMAKDGFNVGFIGLTDADRANGYVNYTYSGLTNGQSYQLSATVNNQNGFSDASEFVYAQSLGDCSIPSASKFGNALTVTLQPNGSKINKVIAVAVSASPTPNDQMMQILEVSNSQITGTYQVVLNFNFAIQYYAVVAVSDVNSAYNLAM